MYLIHANFQYVMCEQYLVSHVLPLEISIKEFD